MLEAAEGYIGRRLASQFIEQRLGVLQVGGVEALGEPAVDFGEHRARLVAAALRREQPRETRRRAQFQRFCTLARAIRWRYASSLLDSGRYAAATPLSRSVPLLSDARRTFTFSASLHPHPSRSALCMRVDSSKVACHET